MEEERPSPDEEAESGSAQTLVEPEQIVLPKVRSANKKRKQKKEKLTFTDTLIRFALKYTSRLVRPLASNLPQLREDILRSNLYISAEGVIALAMLFVLISFPIAIVGIVILALAHMYLEVIFVPTVMVIGLVLGLNIPKISASSRAQSLDNEIPYLVGYVTVLAGGGISPFTTLKRIAKAEKLFPASAREARRILVDIEIFGMDALSALERAARYTPNKMFSDFIGGYVAVLKTGGDAISYLESKLKEIFTYRESKVKSASEFIGTMAEAYIIATVVMGISFTILFATQNLMAHNVQNVDPSMMIMFSMVFVPVISLVFIMVIGSSQTREPFTFELPYYVFLACTPIAAAMYFLPLGLPPYIQLGIGLILTSLPATIIHEKFMRQKRSTETKLPNFLRDISEIRKTGLAPEKTIEQLAGRRYGGLTEHVQKISSQLSWGTPIRTVLQNFMAKVKSWVTQAMAFLLLEVVDVGGGSSRMFISLADFTEKNAQLEKERRSLIRPYLIIPYIGAILVVVTTAMMIYLISAPGLSVPGVPGIASPTVIKESTNILLTTSFFQAWVMGIVAGKMGESSVADGFKHATLLVVISLIAVTVAKLMISF